MSDSVLEKYARRDSGFPAPALDGDGDAEASECFGWSRGIKDRPAMLELRKRDGHVLALGYSWLEQVEFTSESGITLRMASREIRITGSGLNADTRSSVRLFESLVRHRVLWIREADRAECLAMHPGSVLVESIWWD